MQPPAFHPRHTTRQRRTFLLLMLASGLNVFLVFARSVLAYARTHPEAPYAWPEIQGVLGIAYGFLCWNLLLAWAPYLAALQFNREVHAKSAIVLRAGWFALWLAFLPNAPYLVTDFIHLQYRPPVPVWYDIVLLFSFAFTGLMIGVVSLYEMRLALRRYLTRAKTEAVILGAIALAGFGVWLGRFQRWNSWDLLANPVALCRDVARTLTQRHEVIDALGVSGLMASILLIGYGMLSVAAAGNSPEVR